MFGGGKRRRAAWTKVATDLGGQHVPRSRWWRADEHILATIHGVVVELDCYVVSTGNTSQVFTRVGADYAHGPGPKLKVTKKGFWQALGTKIGMVDIAVGDPTFDALFVVRGDSAPLARRLWTPATTARMQALADTWITSKPARLELVGNGRWDHPVKMRAAMELVGALCARDLYGVAGLAAVGAVEQAGSQPPRVVLDTGARVVITAEPRGDDLVTSARVHEPLDVEPRSFEVVDGKAEGATQLPQGAQVHLARVGSGTLTTAPLAFVWHAIELDAERLRAAAALLGAIAAGSTGVYR